MKKISLLLCAVAISSSAFAQTAITNKNGTAVLPSKGSWGIGVDARPFINLVGNLTKINSGSNFNSPDFFNFTDGTSFFGKYFIADDQAYRFRVNLGLGSNRATSLTMQDGQTDPTKTVEDKRVIKNTNIQLVAGKEFRKGSTRLQGFFGYQAMFGFAGSSTKYTYGNDFSSSNVDPTDRDWGPNISGGNSIRTLTSKNGKTISLGVGGFVGAEYFILPQMSIGGELNYNLGISSTGKGELEREDWDAANTQVENTKTETGGSFGFNSQNIGNRLYFMFYF